MIGGLVKDEEIHRLQQQLQDGETCAFAAREHLHLLCRFFSSEHESTEQIAYLVAYLTLCHVVNSLKYGQLAVEK